MINLGSSLKVPYVQELAKEKFASVPPRYIRPDPTKLHGVSTEEIPVIDMQRLLSDESLINHGVSSSLVDKLKLEMQKFFNLKIEEKKRFAQEPGDVEGYGQAFVVSEEQKLDWADMFYMLNEVEGLQIKKAGAWVPVVPLPNAFIVNVGDILEIVTNGIYKSVEHRATVNLHNERLSIATFFSPKLDGDMGTAPSLITPENPAIFRRISMIEYLKAFLPRELDGKSFIDTMRTQIEDF
ncbi:oxoglutarate-dependent flavonoid 7-O-demethylase 1-like [Coffea arabica]|uniref:Oxoglutarate-dependent flavonoid 7-O-demethylase 1-like n=1 Tax=Coffea arabica TaxID=13443 RepID=A0ABM4VPB9_COFAR